METRRAVSNAMPAGGQQAPNMSANASGMGYAMHPMQQQQQNMMTGGYAHASSHSGGGVMPMFRETPGSDRATQLFAVCETCMIVLRVNGYDMSYRRIAERKCPSCSGMLTLPQEIMEMLILYGHFIPEAVAATITLGATVTHPSLRGDFVASAMNELLVPLQTDYVYDVALPKRREGLGMSLRMHKGDLMVGGLIDLEDGTESPSVAARVISVGDVLVAINKKSIASSSFESSIRMLSHAASPVYLTFRRAQPVNVL